MDNSKKIKSRFTYLLKKVITGQSLTRQEAKESLIYLLDHKLGIANDTCFGALFAAIQTKGTSTEESTGLMDAVLDYDRKAMNIKRAFSCPLCGIIGSGKDDLKTFNISTTAAIIAAAAGAKVIKNGSRSEASVAGTTDTLEAIGVNVLSADKRLLTKSLNKLNFAFCDAAPYFPKMVKEYLGKFFFVHPLSFILPIASGIKFDRVVFGLSADNTEMTAQLLLNLGYDNSLVVSGSDKKGNKIDEISNIGPTKISEIKNKQISTYIIHPNDLGFPITTYDKIKEEPSIKRNAAVVKNILSGKDTGPRRDIALMNAGAVLYIAGMAATIKDGAKQAASAIDNGNAIKLLNNFIQLFN